MKDKTPRSLNEAFGPYADQTPIYEHRNEDKLVKISCWLLALALACFVAFCANVIVNWGAV